jgi:hypothetical protein
MPPGQIHSITNVCRSGYCGKLDRKRAVVYCTSGGNYMPALERVWGGDEPGEACLCATLKSNRHFYMHCCQNF